jgi:hypothetical protein
VTKSFMRAVRQHRASLLVLAGMAGLWQILSTIFRAEALPGEPMVPGWQVLVTKTCLSLSDYWQGGLGVESVATGGKPSYLASLLAVVSNSLDSVSLRLLKWAPQTGRGEKLAVSVTIGTSGARDEETHLSDRGL